MFFRTIIFYNPFRWSCWLYIIWNRGYWYFIHSSRIPRVGGLFWTQSRTLDRWNEAAFVGFQKFQNEQKLQKRLEGARGQTRKAEWNAARDGRCLRSFHILSSYNFCYFSVHNCFSIQKGTNNYILLVNDYNIILVYFRYNFSFSYCRIFFHCYLKNEFLNWFFF